MVDRVYDSCVREDKRLLHVPVHPLPRSRSRCSTAPPQPFEPELLHPRANLLQTPPISGYPVVGVRRVFLRYYEPAKTPLRLSEHSVCDVVPDTLGWLSSFAPCGGIARHRCSDYEGSNDFIISMLNHTASALAVYASCRHLWRLRKTRFRGWPTFSGWDWLPTEFL